MNNFIKRIEEFLVRENMSPTAFGIKALGNPTFVFDIRKGRQCLPSTQERVLCWMEDFEHNTGEENEEKY